MIYSTLFLCLLAFVQAVQKVEKRHSIDFLIILIRLV